MVVIERKSKKKRPTEKELSVGFVVRGTFKQHFYYHSYMVMLLEKPLDAYFILCEFDCVL